MKCLGASTVDQLYDALLQYENEEFVNEFRNFIHGKHELSISQRADEKLQKKRFDYGGQSQDIELAAR